MRIAVVVVAVVLSANCKAAGFPFVSACEAALKERLVAPSTYRRIKVTEGREQITFDELLAGFGENAKKLMRVSATREPVRMVAIFEYDAMSANGVALRLKTRCTYETASDPDFDVDTARGLVKIDGEYNRPAEQPGGFTLKRRRPD